MRGWGIAAGLGAAAIWGGMYVVSKYVLAYVPPLTLGLMRLLIGTVVLATVAALARAGPVRRADLPLVAAAGFVGLFLSLGTQFVGTALSTAASGALITSATPAFLVLFAWPILGERITRRRLLGLVFATVAVLLALSPSAVGGDARDPLLGNALLVVAAVTWALYSAMAGRLARRYPVLVVTAYATGVGALCTALVVAIELASTPLGPVPPLAWLGVLYLGVVSTAAAFYLWNKSIDLLGAALPALLFFAQPLVGGLLGALLLGERLEPPFFLGGALIATGVLVTAREG